MKDIFGVILILIGYLATVVSATMINDWFGVFVTGLWVVVLGLVIIIKKDKV